MQATLSVMQSPPNVPETSANVEMLWVEFHKSLRAFFRKRVRDEETAEDLLQEAFLRIHKSIESVAEGANVQAWMYRIARNLVIDHYRARRPSEELGELAAPEENVPDEAVRAFGSCVRSMVETLEPRYREAITLVELEGMTQVEAASKLGLSISGTKSRVQRGRALLRQLVGGCCEVEVDRRGGIIDHSCKSPCC